MLAKVRAGNVHIDLNLQCRIKLLVMDNYKLSQILKRLQVQFREKMLVWTGVHEFCRKFEEGRNLVNNEPLRHVRPTAVTPVKIVKV